MQNVAIFGAPRSGTSWLGQIFNSSPNVAYRFQPLFSYAFKNRITLNSEISDINNFFADLLKTNDDFVLQKKTISGHKGIQFNKAQVTHLIWKEVRYHYLIEHIILNSNIKIIGLVRNPCAVINSWLKAPKEFDYRWNPLKEWKYAAKKNQDKPEEYNGYIKWKELVYMYLRLEKKYPEHFKIQLYEKLNENTIKEVNELFDFVNLNFKKQTENFIRKSKSENSQDPYGVYRKKQDNYKWREELPTKIQESILNDDDFIKINSRFKWH